MSASCIRRVVAFLAALQSVAPASAQTLGSAFTYQGLLKSGGAGYSGTADFTFALFDAALAGTQIGSTLSANAVNVVDGTFTVSLDFGPGAFDGNARWLEIAARTPSGGPPFTTLAPRQSMTAAPYALFALKSIISGPQPNAVSFTNAANSWAGDGSGLTNLNASNISSGTLGLTTSDSFQIISAYNTSSNGGSRAIYARSSAVATQTYAIYATNSSTGGRGVYGEATATTGFTSGGRFESDSTSGIGVHAIATANTGSNYGGFLQSNSASGRGVYGWATAISGTNYGGYFQSDSTGGRGAFGIATAASGPTFGGRFQADSTSGVGVYGTATAATGSTAGVYGVSSSTTGLGVFGSANANSGANFGGHFDSDSTSGVGAYGAANAATGTNYGVYGESNSISGIGVFGSANASSGTTYGGRFENFSTTGRAVFGAAVAGTGINYGVYGQTLSTSGRGVLGVSFATSGMTYGVLGQVDPGSSGYAVYGTGNTGASGTKSFRIDHPDDPANKYLLHYSAESPEVINFYRGTVTLDGAGQAVVELPHYFAKINKSPSYQLTAVGSAMPNLHVAEKISESSLSAGEAAEPDQPAPLCWFRIAGGAPGGEVSWRVEAARNDRWVRQHGAPVEIDKQGEERGVIEHPELYTEK